MAGRPAERHDGQQLDRQEAGGHREHQPGSESNRPRLAAMPTAMKNSPSSSPLKGSISASSSWRNSLSASSTPARKAPSDMDSPATRASSAVAMTVSSAAAVKTSVTFIRATTRSAGRSSSRPPTTMAAMTARSFAGARADHGAAGELRADAAWRDQRQRGEHRQHGKVLEQQDAEGGAAVRRFQLAALGEQLQHQRRGGQREAEADEPGGDRLAARASQAATPSSSRAQQHLADAQSEHDAPHHPQARGLQLQADDEQQQHDAELGEIHDAGHILHQAQAPRSDDQPGGDITQDGAQPQQAEQRDREHRGGEQDGGLCE